MSDGEDNGADAAIAVILTGSDSKEAEVCLAVSGKTVKELFEEYCTEELGMDLNYDLFLDGIIAVQ